MKAVWYINKRLSTGWTFEHIFPNQLCSKRVLNEEDLVCQQNDLPQTTYAIAKHKKSGKGQSTALNQVVLMHAVHPFGSHFWEFRSIEDWISIVEFQLFVVRQAGLVGRPVGIVAWL